MNNLKNGKQLLIALYANVYDTSVGQSTSYMDFFGQFGEVILVTSESNLERIINECDVLGLPGGLDVLSSQYGSRPGLHASKANPHYEYLDDKLLVPWIKTGKPIVAICRGIQVLNVKMGGTLHTHVKGHVQDDKYDRDYAGDEMYTVFENNRIVPINSFHHQAIRKLAPDFVVLGWSSLYYGCPSTRAPKDEQYYDFEYTKVKGQKIPQKSVDTYASCIELIKHRTLPYIGFQYHPEELMDNFSLSLVQATISQYVTVKNTKYATEIQATE